MSRPHLSISFQVVPLTNGYNLTVTGSAIDVNTTTYYATYAEVVAAKEQANATFDADCLAEFESSTE